MALNRIWMPSPCYHGRNTNSIRLIVLHTAEGATTIESLGNFFGNYNNQVSSHVGADDKLGKIGEYVTRGNAAWTQADYNNVALSLELCGFASWSTNTWKNQHHNMLQNCADWIAEESKKFGIPITKLNNSQAQGNGRGVCQHINLGAGGGGHVDCGNGFPMDYVLDLARGKKPTSTPELMSEELLMPVILQWDKWEKVALPIPIEFRDGKGHLNVACNGNMRIHADWNGDSPAGEYRDCTHDGARGFDVPKDKNMVTLRREFLDENSEFQLVTASFTHKK